MKNRDSLSPAGSRRFVRALATSLALAGAMIVAGCGGSSPVASGAASVTGGAGSPDLVTEMLDSWFPATGAQFVDGSLFDNFLNVAQAAVADRCMRARGWDVPMPVETGPTIEADAQSLEDDTLWPNLDWIKTHDLFAPTGGPGSQVGLEVQSKSTAERADYARCSSPSPNPMGAFIRAIAPLGDIWNSKILQLQGSPRLAADKAKMSSCLTRHGATTRGARSVNSFLAYWEPAAQKAQPRGADRLAFEHRWVKIFVGCAAPLITTEQQLQETARKAFLQAHYQELTAAEHAGLRGLAKLERAAGMSSSIVARKS
jgi:hypothetical protein